MRIGWGKLIIQVGVLTLVSCRAMGIIYGHVATGSETGWGGQTIGGTNSLNIRNNLGAIASAITANGTVNIVAGSISLQNQFNIDINALNSSINVSANLGAPAPVFITGAYSGGPTFFNIGSNSFVSVFNSGFNPRGPWTINSGAELNIRDANVTYTPQVNGYALLLTGGTLTTTSGHNFTMTGNSASVPNGGLIVNSTGVISAIPTMTLNDIATTFNGTCSATTLRNQGVSFFNMTGGSISSAITNSARFAQSGGTISGTLTNSGTYTYAGGTVGSIINSGTMTTTATVSLPSVTNTGTWNHSGGTATVATMPDTGLVNIFNGATLNINGNAAGSTVTDLITNDGTLNFTAALTVGSDVSIINNSTVNITSGPLTLNGTFTNSASGDVFNILANLAGSGTITNGGTINQRSVTTYSGTNTIINSGGVWNVNQNNIFNGSTTFTGGTFNVNGDGTTGGGSIAGALTNTLGSNTGAVLNFGNTTTDGFTAQIGTFTTGGNYNVAALNIKNGSTLNVGNIITAPTITLEANGILNANNGSTFNGNINNSGGSGLVKITGTVVVNGNIVNSATNSTIRFENGSSLSGTGSIQNNLLTSGSDHNLIFVADSAASTNTKAISNSDRMYISSGATFTQNTNPITNNATTGLITIISTGTLTGDGGITNNGTINMAGTYSGTGAVNTSAASIWNINSGGNFSGSTGTGTNYGTFNLNGTGTITAAFNGDSGSILNIGNTSASTFSMSAAINNVETISLVTSGSSLETNANAITGVNTLNIASGTTATIENTLTASASGTRVINNYGTLNFNPSATIGGATTNWQTLNAYSNSAINVNHDINFSTMNVLGQSGNTGTTLNIAAAKTLQFAAAINGIKTVTIDGTLTMNPAATLNTFDNLYINGTLNISNGATFTISPGENISGSGSITNSGILNINGANVSLGGTLTNNDSGIINVTGVPTINFGNSFTNSGLLTATFNESNSLPLITVGTVGPTSFRNGTLAIGYQNNYIAGGYYTFIHSTAGVLTTADIGGYILPQPSTYIREWSLVAQNGDIKVYVDRIGFGAVATTAETQIIGNYMEVLGTSNPSQSTLDLLNALEHITDPLLLDAALISISPPNFVALQTVAMLDDIFNVIQGRLGGVRLCYGSGDAEVSNGVWIRPFVSSGKQKPDGNLLGYLDRTNGFVMGIDNQITSNLLLGGAASYASSTVTNLFNNASQTKIKSYQAMMYSTYKSETDAYLDSILSIGTNNFNALRNVNLITYNTTAQSRYSGQQLSFKLQGSKNYIWKKYYQLTPLATAQYSYVRQLPYVETGAGAFNRIVEPNNINLLQLGVGAQFAVPFDERNITSIPSVHAQILVDVAGGNLQTNTQFISGGPILSSNVQAGKLIGVIGGALTFNISDRLELIGNYDFMVRQKYYSNSFYLNLRYTF